MEEKVHNLILNDRKKLNLTKCDEVLSFNENEVVLVCESFTLIVKGSNLKVEEVSRESGDCTLTGESIDSIVYTKSRKSNEGFFRRIIK